MATKKRVSESLEKTRLINQAKREVPGFTELCSRFERTVSVFGKKPKYLQQLL